VTLAALFVDPRGCYAGLPGVEIWVEGSQLALSFKAEHPDARRYAGPHPVVAHPPCTRWCQLAGLVEARYGYRKGEDGGCFQAALEAVRRWGGVLEHPAHTLAWPAYGLPKPPQKGWARTECGGWVCSVEQGQYGHEARKGTWLYAVAPSVPELRWGRSSEPRAVIGWAGNRPGWGNGTPSSKNVIGETKVHRRISKREASATPEEFRDVLLSIARSTR
jgi:hypothetical protein